MSIATESDTLDVREHEGLISRYFIREAQAAHYREHRSWPLRMAITLDQLVASEWANPINIGSYAGMTLVIDAGSERA